MAAGDIRLAQWLRAYDLFTSSAGAVSAETLEAALALPSPRHARYVWLRLARLAGAPAAARSPLACDAHPDADGERWQAHVVDRPAIATAARRIEAFEWYQPHME